MVNTSTCQKCCSIINLQHWLHLRKYAVLVAHRRRVLFGHLQGPYECYSTGNDNGWTWMCCITMPTIFKWLCSATVAERRIVSDWLGEQGFLRNGVEMLRNSKTVCRNNIWLETSLKVIVWGTSVMLAYNFRLVINSNYGAIFHHLESERLKGQKSPKFSTLLAFNAFAGMILI